MKIRMLSTAAGPAGVIADGAVANVPDPKAKELIKLGFAVQAEADAKVNATWPHGDALSSDK